MNLVTAHIFFVCVSGVLVSAFASGVNFAPCRSNSHCADDRSCREVLIDLSDLFDERTGNPVVVDDNDLFNFIPQALNKSCEDDDGYCICLPLKKNLLPCASDSDCSEGEKCYEIPGVLGQICVAEIQMPFLLSSRECSESSGCTSDSTCVSILDVALCFARFNQPDDEGSNVNEPTTEPIFEPIFESTFEPTIEPTFEPTSKPTAETTSGGNIENINNSDTEGDDDEDDGNDDSDGNGDGDGNGVCIAIKSLRQLKPHQLVYQKHMTARVLCDEHGSCATARHMVRFHGRAMMMKSYCELVGNCERCLTLVNSPRYTRALQIPSDTPDLTFTAFAAR